ncbi:2-hydroxy-6-oxohepta-2,4-dienoate hydrolase [Helicobacter sp. 12S02232-10]|uniref:alpha/beta fold hydrolase n=1 Tax=Helicobacter sp. 12S02232-10 TaxID=1476197 RepID=UPI000BA564C7|nr:alpha/beta hydrolase [Helicobacter sp. 12S02232-10]PAF47679.1 2-hydroxy-6-oxohepta-2,4-dienoate hydrolase [Helicobacter sp. 12S02232-10]
MAKRSIIYQNNTFEIAYTFYNRQAKKNIIFLHGWGSNKELMESAFKDVFTEFNHCYIDLPGFGNSPNSIIISTDEYAHIIDSFLRSLSIKADLIVGHSFGGKLALLCQNDEIILLSSSGILVPKPLKVKIKIILAKIFKILKLKTKIFRSADANNLNEAMYAIFKNVVQEDFEPIYANCTKKATIFWGKEDKATPLATGYKISKLIAKNRFFILDGDHYFFLKQGKIIDEKYHSRNLDDQNA